MIRITVDGDGRVVAAQELVKTLSGPRWFFLRAGVEWETVKVEDKG